jgi:short-subunit dehydrogenase
MSLTAREKLKEDNIAVSVVYPYITLTDFEKNTIKHIIDDDHGQEDTGQLQGDTAEYVAQLILGGIESGEAEIFAHDWMKSG